MVTYMEIHQAPEATSTEINAELLEALEEIRRNCDPWKKADNMAGRLFEIADRAIAKAKGEA